MNSGSMGSNIIEWAGRLWILAAIPAAKKNASTSITEMLSLITLKIIIWRRCAQFGFKELLGSIGVEVNTGATNSPFVISILKHEGSKIDGGGG